MPSNMWWKIYFWFTILEAVFGILGLFATPGEHVSTQIIMIIIFLVAVGGLYTYVFNKKFLPEVFWQYFLGIYILIDIAFLIYAAFPHVPIIASLSFLSIYKDNTFLSSAIGVFVDIPLLIALYRLTQGNVHASTVKKNTKQFNWGMIQTALWGYSTVLVFLLLILTLIPSANSTVTHQEASDSYYIATMFAPLLLFWLWVLVTFKHYHWNWWKTTLAANGLFYSGTIMIGIFYPQSGGSASGFDIFSVLQILILLIGLWVFGSEEFSKRDA